MTDTAAPTDNKALVSWVQEIAELAKPDAIQWCDGSSQNAIVRSAPGPASTLRKYIG